MFFSRILSIAKKSGLGYIIHRKAVKILEKTQRLTDKKLVLRTIIKKDTYIDSWQVCHYE